MEKATVMITGATGTLGRELVNKLAVKGKEIKILARDVKAARQMFPDFEVLKGDITQDNLGLIENPRVEAIYHLAGLIDLGSRKKEQLWNINVSGTKNVIRLTIRYNIPHIFFCSTAYAPGSRNFYEDTKMIAEGDIKTYAGVGVGHYGYTIFKPSIIVPSMKTLEVFEPQHLYTWVLLLARFHHRAEIVRKTVEGTLHLPPKRMGFRIKGNPQATLNMVPVDWVAEKMASIENEGTYWLTNPKPVPFPTLLEWFGEVLFLDLKVESEFTMTSIETLFHHLTQPLLNYAQSDIPLPLVHNNAPPITKEFIQKTITNCILRT